MCESVRVPCYCCVAVAVAVAQSLLGSVVAVIGVVVLVFGFVVVVDLLGGCGQSELKPVLVADDGAAPAGLANGFLDRGDAQKRETPIVAEEVVVV